ncbi:putative bifunctional diguanylate cyclase/phosphodiesterase [Blastococcus haudaquaticus]|uniref:Diguanylate cyclase (GGDEF) domain-containing protein n=1 Tax=Blastococcus haudaquaticus TaxID=1938745 RepID=A0A286H5I5_9ACTN|nr:EAL domain-containing protein [Blastococcus haudaquaticus]SOE02952.1 diguanylate cyclase (GGDEF) domain-containing protein [Blastococcus haudaquaticus]
MAGRPRSRLLPGAPRWLLVLTLLGAVGFALFGVARLVRPGLFTGLARSLDVPVLVVLHTALLVLLAWRARRVVTERAVWNRLALGAAVFVVALLVVLVLAVLPATREIAGLPIIWAGVAVFPFWYGALVRWNRYSTSLADPNDVLNGAAAVLAVVAVLNVVLEAVGSPLTRLPWWELQAQLAQFAVCFVLLGTALTLPSIGAMGRDLRTWLVVLAFSAGLAGTTATFVAGGERVGWGAITQPCVIACLALAACLRSRRSAPQPTDPGAATIGAFVVIVASTLTLALSTVTGAVGAATWCAALATAGAGVRLVVNIRELAQLAVTRREALTDELTGLANRRAVLRRVEELCAEGTPLALALLDLDKFKEVNDALGHAAGDDLLRMVATRLEAVLRPGDLLGRLGGDEFAVVALMDADVPLDEAARAVGRRLHDRLAEPFVIGGMAIHSAVSVGVTTSTGDPDDGQAPTQLLREADVAMYDAKRSGAGISLYDSTRHADSSGHLALVEELRTAMSTGQLVLHHQPQLDIVTGATVGVEALVRWQHPVRGLLYPGDFLPLAEVHGLMGTLTEVVLAQAVTQAAARRAEGLELPVSVNLSASNLLDVALPARVADLLVRHDLPPALLVLEVTESVLLTDPERSLAVVGALADLGATVSIDDYGTGYSSLAYLRDLPVAELKLDRSFTADLLTDARTEAIVASTIELAHRLGLRVVAEGVEDEGTLTHLRSLDCDVSQGYLHARPLPAEELGCWLAAHAPAAVVASPV